MTSRNKTQYEGAVGEFVVVLALYLLFLVWVESWLGLIVVPFIFDVYITKKIHWQWWKDEEGPVRFIMSWVDALVFALVADLFHQPLLLPELRYSVFLSRKKSPHGRLSLREQGKLRTSHPSDSAHHAI